VPNFEDAEGVVQETLSKPQQAIIVQGAKNPALVIYALGNNPTKARELARISNPVEFAFAVANLEAQLKVNRKTPPPPEKTEESTGPLSGTNDCLRRQIG
jgi:hypothetical protein